MDVNSNNPQCLWKEQTCLKRFDERPVQADFVGHDFHGDPLDTTKNFNGHLAFDLNLLIHETDTIIGLKLSRKLYHACFL